jgi:hypothetical protein
LPEGRADMGADSGCSIGVVFLLLLFAGLCVFARFLIPQWLWPAFF